MEEERLRVVFLGHVARRTGAPILLLSLLQSLRPRPEIDLKIILLEGGELEGEFRATAPTLVLGKGSLASRILRKVEVEDALHLWRARAFLGRKTPQVIYANSVATLGLAIALKRALPRSRVLCHCHELAMAVDEHVGTKRFAALAREVDLFIAVSSSMKVWLVEAFKIEAERVHVVHEFIAPPGGDSATRLRERDATRAELGIAPDAFVVGSCGTADWRKSPDLMVQIAKKMSRRNGCDKIHFVWLGGTNGQHKALRYDMERLGLKNVTLIEARSDVSRFMISWDLFLLTSREDPFPMVCLEAAAHGLPVICFDRAGGMPEFVRTDAGFIAPYLDLDFVSDKIVSLDQDRTLLASLGACACERVMNDHLGAGSTTRILREIEAVASRSAAGSL